VSVGQVVSDGPSRVAALLLAFVGRFLPALVTAVAFLALFAQPLVLLVQDWWQLPEAGHGLLLAPTALWLAWRSGIREGTAANHGAGIAILLAAVFIRYVSGLAAELFTMRESMVLALAGLTVYHYGIRQLVWWWLPFTLAALTVPLPELVTQQLALPLQFEASRIGAKLLSSRHVPVELAGNIIRLPGRELFVTEACSGLRSLTALVSLGVLIGGVALRHPVSRLLLLALAIPVAILINGVRVFITGFLVYFVSPSLGEGFMHITEGWLLFVVSFASLSLLAWGFVLLERYVINKRKTRDA
jgi:exosortase